MALVASASVVRADDLLTGTAIDGLTEEVVVEAIPPPVPEDWETELSSALAPSSVLSCLSSYAHSSMATQSRS
jgi:hypothetical protein